MIIDCHVHRYPEKVSKDPVAFAESRGEKHWLQLVAPKGKASIQGWANGSEMRNDMEAGGVNKVAMLGWYWENPETCFEHNRWHADWLKEDSEHFLAFAATHPLGGNQSIEDLKRARDSGFQGIGEIMPTVQGFSMQDPEWRRIVEFAIGEDWPVNFHVSEPVGPPHAGRIPTPLEDFQWLAETYPELKIILAHWGGLLPFHELNPFIRETFGNVWYDVAASPLLYDSKIFRAVVDAVGEDKVLYGSDYPLLLYPRIQKNPDFESYLIEINESGLNQRELKKILGENFSDLIGLPKENSIHEA